MNSKLTGIAIAAAIAAVLALVYWPAPDGGAPDTGATAAASAPAGRSLASYLNIDATPVADAAPVVVSLAQRLERLGASGKPEDAYAAYNLIDDCIVFQRESRLPGMEFELGREMTVGEKTAQQQLCAGLTQRQREDRLGYLATAAQGGVPGAATLFLSEGPFGDRSALRNRPDDPLVQAWKRQAIAQLTAQADEAELTSVSTLMMAYLRDGDVVQKDAPQAYGYLLALRMVYDDILTPGTMNPYQDSYWHWLQNELTPEQQAAALSKANGIAAKFRQHTGRPTHG
ncbi:hypothetical protein IGS59_07630 [Janthinobacterium sp. GW460P]|uniref:hypothetical protein n=1 Tax=unclassified Janthinobacterium TaxID=2610881 RepID=UPI000A3212ED|nr:MULTISPECIES: hypothetical protein [unclassified Janthinobacterium]MCC7702102.1 hypothetical protein [Janthinobacterium sp. GW460P]MCC7707610.1 hypothetical protein [Janthinobacterium sp. GW460W]